MKKAILAALLALMLTLCAAGCTAEDYLDPERNAGSGEVITENANYGNVSTTRNGIVNGDNRNLVANGEELIGDFTPDRR